MSTILKKAIAGDSVTAMDLASTLCTGCGLCCTGLLYGQVRLFPEDGPRLKRHPLPVLHRDEGPRFELPCPHLQAKQCGIYEHRYTTCRTFKCELLQRLERGEHSLDEALSAVAEAQQLVAQLQQDLNCDSAERKLPRAIAEKLTEVQTRSPMIPSPAEARFLLHVRMLWMHFTRYFDRRQVDRYQRNGEAPTRQVPELA